MIYLVSDFSYEEISGGAEYVDKYFLNNVEGAGFLRCRDLTEFNYSNNDQYIISNFSYLSENVKSLLIQNNNYVINLAKRTLPIYSEAFCQKSSMK